MSRQLKISAITLLGVVILWACSGAKAPRKVADQFLVAIKTGDKQTASLYISRESAENFKRWTASETGDPSEIEIISVFVNEKKNEAIVKYNDEGKEKQLTMKKEDGDWKCIFDAGKGASEEDISKQIEELGKMFGDSTKTK